MVYNNKPSYKKIREIFLVKIEPNSTKDIEDQRKSLMLKLDD